jgi:starch-binding outer membrane protein SusE/F
MKNRILCFILITGLSFNYAYSQCGAVSMMGEFNLWTEDYPMFPDPQDSNLYRAFIYLDINDDPQGEGIIDLKFRQDSSWLINWGNNTFPEGTAILNGPNIPVPFGNYYVTFNCVSGNYSFLSTCGAISLIGEFNDYLGDLEMNRQFSPISLFMLNVEFTEEDDTNLDGFVDIKFRENSDWAYNWGGTVFPEGIAVLNGPVLSVPYGNYDLTFDCNSLFYSFLGTIGMNENSPNDDLCSVYPNPAGESLFISLKLKQEVRYCQITINDLSGKIISEELFATVQGNNVFRLDVSHMNPGIYSCRVNLKESISEQGNPPISRKILILR